MKINIIGAGVIGIMSAYYLIKLGYEVNIIESANSFCTKASGINSNQLSFSHTLPIINNSLLTSLASFILGQDSNLAISKNNILKITPQNIKKSLLLLRNTRKFSELRNAILAAQKSLKSLDNLNQIINNHNLESHFSNTGTLHFSRHKPTLNNHINHAKQMLRYGVDYRLWSKDTIQNKAPYLDDYNPIGGIFFPLDKSADTISFIKDIITYLKSTGKITFYYNEEIKEFLFHNTHNIKSLVTKNNVIPADATLICCGAEGKSILTQLQVKLDYFTVRGYCYHIDLDDSLSHDLQICPNISLSDMDNRIVMSTNNNQLKIAGIFEFTDINSPINQALANSLLSKIKVLFPQLSKATKKPKLHTGYRAVTSNNQPIIKKDTRISNLFINTGYGSLGWTQSFFGGHAISKLIKKYIK